MSVAETEPSLLTASAQPLELSPAEQAASQPFVGRWNRLISTTNWEKGAIIVQWRETLVAAGAPVTGYSDEAWCRLVGGLTPQHVGRLRRVQQRFGGVQNTYQGLYWSHFFAALDWDDSEMWLEGAVQNRWSVSQLRNQRWETLGRVGQQPEAADEIAAEVDEDLPGSDSMSDTLRGSYDELPGPRHEVPDFGDEEAPYASRESDGEANVDSAPVELVQPFANLPPLPDDLSEAFDGLKLALLRHKTEGWAAVSCEAVLAWLEAMKSLATAPTSETAAPF